MVRIYAALALTAALLLALALPPAASQQGVSWTGYAVVSPGPTVVSLRAQVRSAPLTLSIPICGNATGYWAYENSTPLAAYISNGSLEVPVLTPGTINVTLVETGCARQVGSLYEAWVFMPGPGTVIASNGTAILYFRGNATPLGPTALSTDGGNVTVFLAVNLTSASPTPTSSAVTTSTTSTSTVTVINTTTPTMSSTSTATSTSTRPTTTAAVSTSTAARTSSAAQSTAVATKAETSGFTLLDSIATIIVLVMIAAVIGYLATRR